MKHMDLSKKTAVLAGLLFAVILCGAMFFAAFSERGNHIITKPATFEDRLILEQSKVRKNLCDSFECVNDAMVSFEATGSEISMAYIFIIASEEISDSDMNHITEYIQNYFEALPREQIGITYVDPSYKVLKVS